MNTEKINRWADCMRRALCVVLLVGLAPAIAQTSVSSAPYRLVVPVAAGGPLDGLARLLARVLARNLDEHVIVDNRPGAFAMIGTEYVVKASPDGRTLLVATSFLVTNAVQYKLNFDPLRDLRAVIQLGEVDHVLVARSELGASGVADLQRVAGLQRGGLNCAAPPGEMALACERLKVALGGAVVVIPYSSIGPAMTALMGGQVDVMFAPRDAVVPQLETRRILPLASGAPQRPPAPLDKLPLLKDVWPGFTASGFTGILVPAGTPQATVTMLNREFNRVLLDPQVHAWLAAWGTPSAANAPGKLAQTLSDKALYYRQLAEQIGLKPQ